MEANMEQQTDETVTRAAYIQQIIEAIRADLTVPYNEDYADYRSRELDEIILAQFINSRIELFTPRLNQAPTAVLQKFTTTSARVVQLFLHEEFEDEQFILEMLMHPAIGDAEFYVLEESVRGVRSSLGVDSIASLDPSHRKGVESALTVSMAWKKMMDDFDDIRSEYSYESGMLEPEMTALIFEYPDRTEDIISYIRTQEEDYKAVSTDHLRLHLETARPLTAGVL